MGTRKHRIPALRRCRPRFHLYSIENVASQHWARIDVTRVPGDASQFNQRPLCDDVPFLPRASSHVRCILFEKGVLLLQAIFAHWGIKNSLIHPAGGPGPFIYGLAAFLLSKASRIARTGARLPVHISN